MKQSNTSMLEYHGYKHWLFWPWLSDSVMQPSCAMLEFTWVWLKQKFNNTTLFGTGISSHPFSTLVTFLGRLYVEYIFPVFLHIQLLMLSLFYCHFRSKSSDKFYSLVLPVPIITARRRHANSSDDYWNHFLCIPN